MYHVSAQGVDERMINVHKLLLLRPLFRAKILLNFAYCLLLCAAAPSLPVLSFVLLSVCTYFYCPHNFFDFSPLLTRLNFRNDRRTDFLSSFHS